MRSNFGYSNCARLVVLGWGTGSLGELMRAGYSNCASESPRTVLHSSTLAAREGRLSPVPVLWAGATRDMEIESVS